MHAFSYAVYMVWLDLAELDTVFRGRWFWSTKRRALAWFRRADYLGDAAISLDEAVRRRVAQSLGKRPSGPIRMLSQLRNFGHCFNPVTFYYCYDTADTRVETIVAEITNTPWRERHSYVLPAPAAASAGAALQFEMPKQFHVSPFMSLDQGYRWQFTVPGERLAVHMENLQDSERGVRRDPESGAQAHCHRFAGLRAAALSTVDGSCAGGHPLAGTAAVAQAGAGTRPIRQSDFAGRTCVD